MSASMAGGWRSATATASASGTTTSASSVLVPSEPPRYSPARPGSRAAMRVTW